MYGVRGYKKRRGLLFWLVAIIIVVTLLFIVMLFFNVLKSDRASNNAKELENINKAMNKVVGIYSEGSNGNIWGSGVVISTKGYILTNYHILGNELNCTAIIEGNNRQRADVVWKNEDLDLAVLKVSQSFDSAFNILNSEEINVGQQVYSIGNPINHDFEKSVTKGIISGLNRNLEFEENQKKLYLTNLIQTDASINMGSSGGALIDESGNIIGINTIKITSAENMGFAVPVDIIKPVIEKIETKGECNQPNLGIWCYDKYTIGKQNLNITLNKGVYVAQVDSNSSGEKSGIRPGDVILNVDEVEIKNLWNFRKILYEKNVGDSINLSVLRDNKIHTVILRLE